MKYRLDFVTNSSSSSSVVLRLDTTHGSKKIQYTFNEPGFWNFPSFRMDKQKSLVELLSNVSEAEIRVIGEDDIFSLPKEDDYDGTLNYQLVYNHLVLNKIRAMFHDIYNNDRFNQIDGVIKMTTSGQVFVVKSLLNKLLEEKISTESLDILKSLRLIINFEKKKVSSYEELKNHPVLKEIYGLSTTEVITGFDESVIQNDGEFDSPINTIVDLKGHKVNTIKGHPDSKLYLNKLVNYRINLLKEDGRDVSYFDKLLERKSDKYDNLVRINWLLDYTETLSNSKRMFMRLWDLIGDVDEFEKTSSDFLTYWYHDSDTSKLQFRRFKTLIEMCLDSRVKFKVLINALIKYNILTPLQGLMAIEIYEIKKIGLTVDDEYENLLQKRIEIENSLLIDRKAKTEKKKLRELGMQNSAPINIDSTIPLVSELTKEGLFPEKSKTPISILIKNEQDNISISYKPKASVNRIQQLFLDTNEKIYYAHDVSSAPRDNEGIIDLRNCPIVPTSEIVEQVHAFLKLCLIYTNPIILQQLINQVAKKKSGELYKGRALHIATLNVSKGSTYNELIAYNEDTNKISLEIRSIKAYGSNYSKAQTEKTPSDLIGQILGR